MAKLFNNIRKKLISDKPSTTRTVNYLKYAIGEIVLVVIGIMIALSINNWKETKNAQVKERNALSEIISDLDLNIKTLTGNVYTDANSINKCINSLKIIITNIEHTKVYNDSLAYYFMLNFRYPTFVIKTSGFQSLTSTGIDLISDNKLRSDISNYYSYYIPQGKVAFDELRDDFYHYMLDLLRTEFIGVGLENDTKIIVPVNYEILLKNREYIESLKSYISVYNSYRDTSIEIIDQSKKLKHKTELKLHIND